MSDYHIPFDILVEIMKRLPVKSLLRFTSVSKQCKSFIQSSKFIAEYQQRTKHNLFVSYLGLEDSLKKYVSIVDDDTFPQQKFSLSVPESLNEPMMMVGSSRGLFCFYTDYGDNVVIWNPSIRKLVDIDVPHLIYQGLHFGSVVGFGVCPHTCDPMLVRIKYFRSCYISAISIPPQVEVFTLSSGDWRSLYINLPRKSILFSTNNVDLDGIIHWAVVDRFHLDGTLQHNNMIISFDMTTENFKEIHLPDYLRNCPAYISIYKLRESLVVLKPRSEAKKEVFDIWVMENGDRKSFTKLFTITPPDNRSRIRNVLGFSKSGKPIIVIIKGHYESHKLYVYEPNSNEFNYIGKSTQFAEWFAVSYMETLLLLDRTE